MSEIDSSRLCVMAISHHGEKLRDAGIAISVWDSRDAAFAELREIFADDLADARELGLVVDPCGRRDPDTEDGLLEALRWYLNVVVEIEEPEAVKAAVRRDLTEGLL